MLLTLSYSVLKLEDNLDTDVTVSSFFFFLSNLGLTPTFLGPVESHLSMHLGYQLSEKKRNKS